MAAEKSPAFQFYVRDWRSSRKVQVMSFKERGMYLEMLIEQWDKGAAPASAGACALALGGTEIEWTRSWPALSACFTARKRDGLLINAKLEAIRRDKRKYHKAQSDNGLEGARARWRRDGGAMASPESGIAKNGSASASALASSTATADLRTPNPLSAKGGRLRILRVDRQEAKRLLKQNFGHCTHEPKHSDVTVCEAEIAAALAERRRDAEQAAAS